MLHPPQFSPNFERMKDSSLMSPLELLLPANSNLVTNNTGFQASPNNGIHERNFTFNLLNASTYTEQRAKTHAKTQRESLPSPISVADNDNVEIRQTRFLGKDEMCHPRALRVSLASRFDDCVMQSLQHRELVDTKETNHANTTNDVLNEVIKELADDLKDFKTVTPTTLLEDRKSQTAVKSLFQDYDTSSETSWLSDGITAYNDENSRYRCHHDDHQGRMRSHSIVSTSSQSFQEDDGYDSEDLLNKPMGSLSPIRSPTTKHSLSTLSKTMLSAIFDVSCQLDSDTDEESMDDTMEPLPVDLSIGDIMCSPQVKFPSRRPTRIEDTCTQQQISKLRDYTMIQTQPCFVPSSTSSSNIPRRVSITSEPSKEQKSRGKRVDNWYRSYNELRAYYKKNGHCSVPRRMLNKSMFQFIRRQRYEYKLILKGKPSSLTKDRLDALNAIGFVWDAYSCQWEERYEELKEFRRCNGHCKVPYRYPLNQKLATWVKIQRRQRALQLVGKESSMTTERFDRLEELGFSWRCRGKQS